MLTNAHAARLPFADGSIHVFFTSPPYYGLRLYVGLPPQVWGGDSGCDHVWQIQRHNPQPHGDDGYSKSSSLRGGLSTQAQTGMGEIEGAFCRHCGVWHGHLGNEPDFMMFVDNLVIVGQEVWRCLRDDGLWFLNLGDSYSTGIGSDIRDCLYSILKGGMIFLTGPCSTTISPKSDNVLNTNQLPPDSEFFTFLGVKRVFIKQRNNDLHQVINLLDPNSYTRISPSVTFSIPSSPNTIEIILDEIQSISIVISDLDIGKNSSFGTITPLNSSVESPKMSFAIKEAREPIPESIGDIKPDRNTISLDPASEGILNVDLVNKSISFGDGFTRHIGHLLDFAVIKASIKQLSLSLFDDRVDLAIRCVAHLLVSNAKGSFIRYQELYAQAEQKSNTCQPKQKLGIPHLVKESLVRDGWICRQALPWIKKNPLPESVSDRPSTAHEYVFMLAKSERYFWDAERVKRDSKSDRMRGPALHPDLISTNGNSGLSHRPIVPTRQYRTSDPWTDSLDNLIQQTAEYLDHLKRIRDNNGLLLDDAGDPLALYLSTRGYAGAHYATFPPDLVRDLLRGATSEVGCCEMCGAPWERITEKDVEFTSGSGKSGIKPIGKYNGTEQAESGTYDIRMGPVTKTITTGWLKPCTCPTYRLIPAIVCDPFCGSGTVGEVAGELGLRFVGADLSAEYLATHAAVRAEGRTTEAALIEARERIERKYEREPVVSKRHRQRIEAGQQELF